MSTHSFSIKEIIEKIDSKEILLPAMQRKFVWSEDKIINLFDSMMKGYPFGSFIFWNIYSKDEIKKYHFYQFIKDYSEKDSTINEKAGKIVNNSIDVVMDGQQRLTSFYIGLKGSITTKKKGAHKRIAENWKKKHLYIKPYISPDEKNEDETPFRFSFLEDSFAEEWNKAHERFDHYFLVSDFYGLTKRELYDQLGVKRLRCNEDDWRLILEYLRWYINDAEIIIVHSIKNTNISDVLEIFRRINNGGTKLSPANLLFSTVITSWDKGREKMDDFITMINGDGVICIKEDFLIRACLYLLNKPAAAKIEILTKDVVELIKNNWEKIKDSIIDTKKFLKKHNIYAEAILSYNVLLPIVYYYYHLDPSTSKKAQKESEEQLFYFFAISQMFSLFGGSSASTLEAVRKKLCRDYDSAPGELIMPFNIKNLFDIDLSAGRIHAFKIDKEQIENLVDTVSYGQQKAFCLLCLLQPNIVINAGYYDVDHVCSKDELRTVSRYKRSEERIDLDRKKNLISNLQLLDYKQNRTEKNADSLYTWVVEKKNTIPFDPYRNDNCNEKYKINSIEDFLNFYEKRRSLIIAYLCNCFGVSE